MVHVHLVKSLFQDKGRASHMQKLFENSVFENPFQWQSFACEYRSLCAIFIAHVLAQFSSRM